MKASFINSLVNELFPNASFLLSVTFFALFMTSIAQGAVMQDKKPLKILAIGDSTTAGTPAFRSPVEAPPNGEGNEQSQYAYWVMKKHPDWQVINRGVNGQRSDQILKRLERELDLSKSEVVIILAGVNDLYQGVLPETVEANLAKMYEISLKKNLTVVACSILPYNTAGDLVRERMRKVNDWIHSYSVGHGFIFCDTFKTLNDHANSFHLKESPDGLHPSIEGYKQMGEAIADSLEKTLK